MKQAAAGDGSKSSLRFRNHPVDCGILLYCRDKLSRFRRTDLSHAFRYRQTGELVRHPSARNVQLQ